MNEQRPLKPALHICIAVEAEPEVWIEYDEPNERDRVLDWVHSRWDLEQLVTLARSIANMRRAA